VCKCDVFQQSFDYVAHLEALINVCIKYDTVGYIYTKKEKKMKNDPWLSVELSNDTDKALNSPIS